MIKFFLLPYTLGVFEDFYDVDGQTKHKLLFIQEHVPNDARLILIGHSIGALIAVRLLNCLSNEKILKCCLLFPTMEHLAKSPMGSTCLPIVKYLSWCIPLPAYILYYLPDFVKKQLATLYFCLQGFSVSDFVIKATLQLVDPSCVRKIFYLGANELRTIQEADHDSIEKHSQKLMMYYGLNDHWCPQSLYECMKKKHPDGIIIQCKKGFQHAFVLEESAAMATTFYHWITEHIPFVEC